MPTISIFFGITIRMYFDDHGPPHFHAFYGDHAAKYDIESLAIIAGRMSRRAESLILEWAAIHQQELRSNWRAAELHEPLHRVEPLD